MKHIIATWLLDYICGFHDGSFSEHRTINYIQINKIIIQIYNKYT